MVPREAWGTYTLLTTLTILLVTASVTLAVLVTHTPPLLLVLRFKDRLESASQMYHSTFLSPMQRTTVLCTYNHLHLAPQ